MLGVDLRKFARGSGCLWKEEGCNNDSYNGEELGLVEWARANGCPWNGTTPLEPETTEWLGVCQWARSLCCVGKSNRPTVKDLLAENDVLVVLTRVREYRCPRDFLRRLRCRFGRDEGLGRWIKYRSARFQSWEGGACAAAAGGGHLAVLQWARASGCPWGSMTCIRAARGGHLDVLKWARANGCDWGWEVLDAAENGDMEAWRRANGCERGWEGNGTKEAAWHSKFKAVREWAVANGCPPKYDNEFIDLTNDS